MTTQLQFIIIIIIIIIIMTNVKSVLLYACENYLPNNKKITEICK